MYMKNNQQLAKLRKNNKERTTCMSLSRFTLLYLGYTFVLALGAKLLSKSLPQVEILAENFWQAFLLLFLLTYVAYVVSYRGIKFGAQGGVMTILGCIVLKLLLALSYVLFVITKTTVNQLVFALDYFSLYLLFSLF